MERVSTGIRGFDVCVSGGLAKNTSTLITGSPGAGKSVFCMQFLVNGANAGEPGMYISLEEDEKQLMHNFSSFKWDIDKLVKGNKILLRYMTPESIESFTKDPFDPMLDAVRLHGVKRIVIDSTTAYEMMFDKEHDRRRGLLRMLDALKRHDVTVLLTAERATTEPELVNLVDFLSNGVVVLYNIRQGSERTRGMEVLKMRATKHSQKIMPIKIDENGIEVYSDESFFAEVK